MKGIGTTTPIKHTRLINSLFTLKANRVNLVVINALLHAGLVSLEKYTARRLSFLLALATFESKVTMYHCIYLSRIHSMNQQLERISVVAVSKYHPDVADSDHVIVASHLSSSCDTGLLR